MKTFQNIGNFLAAVIVAGWGAMAGAYEPAPCGPIVPAVPVVTYYGCPAVNYTPGHWWSAGPHPCPYGYSNRGPWVLTRVYCPGLRVRNALR